MKGEVVKLVLQTISEGKNKSVYDVLEAKGYPKSRSWSSVPRLKRLGYISQLGKGKYVLTEKGKAKLNRLLYGLAQCPFCGSTKVRLNGKRDGTGNQRYLCNSCRFTWTQGKKEEAIMRALKKRKRVIFILHTNEKFGYIILQKLKEWLKSEELGYLAKHVALIVP